MILWWVVREHLGTQGNEGVYEPMVGVQGAHWYAGTRRG